MQVKTTENRNVTSNLLIFRGGTSYFREMFPAYSVPHSRTLYDQVSSKSSGIRSILVALKLKT